MTRGTALLRLDFNTEDDWRMRAVLPTIQFLLKRGCKIVIVSHRGRPTSYTLAQLNNGKRTDKKLSLRKDAVSLSRMLKKKVTFVGHFDLVRINKAVEQGPILFDLSPR